MTRTATPRSGLLALAALVVVSACAQRPEPAPVVYRGTEPRAAPARRATPPQPATPVQDDRGVIDYGGYAAVVARPGDTVASIAERVGLSAAALASYNGLPAGHVPQAGDELILPPAPDGSSLAAAPTSSSAVATAPLPAPGAAPSARVAALEPASTSATDAAPAGGFDLSRIEAAIDDPAATPAPAAPPAPPPAPVAPPAASAVSPAPSAAAPAPTRVAAAPAPEPAAVAPAARFAPPVSGPIVRPFSRGAARNDGVDFGAPAGAPVAAAADGQIALVSESLGGLGTIVLIRHQNDLLTVYGRVDEVTVQKGDRVRQGQVIGKVAAGAEGRDPTLHFEVRQGAESVDPARFLPG